MSGNLIYNHFLNPSIISGFTILTAGVFQPVMYFWNVVLSYVRKDNAQNRERVNSNDIELGEQLSPNSKHTVIYNPKEIKRPEKSHMAKDRSSSIHKQKQSNARPIQQRRGQGTNPTHYYQTPADQRNYHML